MPKYSYNLIEETILTVEIDAESREEADGKAEDMIYGGDLDWILVVTAAIATGSKTGYGLVL